MDESKYNRYDYYTSNNQYNTINNLNPKELDYNLVKDEHISNTRKYFLKPILSLRNNYDTR